MTAALVAAFGVNLALAVLNAALYAQDTSRWWNLGAACLSGGVAAYGLVVLGRSLTRIATTEAATLRMVPNALDEASAVRYASRALGSWTWRGDAYCHASPETVADALAAWLVRQAGRAA